MSSFKVATSDGEKDVGLMFDGDNYINAKTFKCDDGQFVQGDGIHDDTTGINKAFNSRKNIYFPSGVYIVSSTLNLKSNTNIKGDGKSTIFLAKNGTPRGTTLFNIDTQNNIKVDNITVDGNINVNTDGDASDGIHLFDVWNSTNIHLINFTSQNNKYSGSRWINCSNVHVNNCEFINVDCGIITMGETASDFYINGCLFDGHIMSEPISFFSSGLMQDIHISNCNFRNKSTTAILLGNQDLVTNPNSLVNNFTIDNIIVENCTGGISLYSASNGIISNVIFTRGATYGHHVIDTNVTNNVLFKNITAVNCDYHSIVIGQNSFNLSFENINIINCGYTDKTESVSYFMEINGHDNRFNNINCISTTNYLKSIYIFGNNNIITNLTSKVSASETVRIVFTTGVTGNHVESKNFGLWDMNISNTVYASNKFISKTTVVTGDSLPENLGFSYSETEIVNNFATSVLNPTNMSLLWEGAKIRIIYHQYYSSTTTINLITTGNIVWTQGTSPITSVQNEIIVFDFVCINNKWYETNRLIKAA